MANILHPSARGLVPAALAFAFALGCSQASLAQQPVTLKFGSFTAANGSLNRDAIPAFIKAVEEESKGTIKFDFFPGGSFGSSPTAQLKLVEDGVADIVQAVASYTPGRFPELNIVELPFLARDNITG